MPETEEPHECDLFLMSSHHAYFADRALTEFAQRGNQNIHGWGIGSFAENRARVLRSADAATQPDRAGGTLSREFAIAVQAVSSEVILGHLRLTSCGATRRENNHPFQLPFLGSEWLFIHNGTARNPESLVPSNERLLTASDNDSPRVFEFMRSKIIEYVQASPKKSVIEGFREAYGNLIEIDPNGKFNLIFSNGHISVVFIHFRPFYLLHREKDAGNAALISTIRLTENENWVKFEKGADRKARMLVFSGPSLIFNGDIPK